MGDTSVTRYYDRYVERQSATGVNARHHLILQLALDEGLREAGRVLEIGCGIGTVTGLLSNAAPQARILASDLSPASIDLARVTYKGRTNITWQVIDVVNDPIEGVFDLIVLPDVLEHIPEEHHEALFTRLRWLLAPNGRILIHSPDPYYNDWARIAHPELLQVIDLALHLPALIKHIHAGDLTLSRFQRHSIWREAPDYMALTLVHLPLQTDFRDRERPAPSLWARVRARFARHLR